MRSAGLEILGRGCEFPGRVGGLRRGSFSAPGTDAHGINGNAEQVGRDEAELRRSQADETDKNAVESGHGEAKPELTADQNS